MPQAMHPHKPDGDKESGSGLTIVKLAMQPDLSTPKRLPSPPNAARFDELYKTDYNHVTVNHPLELEQ